MQTAKDNPMAKQDTFLDGQQDPTRSVSDYVDESEVFKPNPPLSDYLNKTLIAIKVMFKPSKFGEMAILTVADPTDQIEFIVNTGAALVLKQLHILDNKNAWPILITPNKVQGTRQIILK